MVGTVSGTTYRATGLSASTSYTFTVRARDAAGNVSAASPALTVTTPAGNGNGDAGCAATYRVTSSWQGGYQAEVTVRNTGTAAISGWTVTWTAPAGTTIASLWNGRLTTSGSTVTVRNEPYNGQLAADASTTFGLTGSGSGTPSGLTCTAS